MAQTTVDTSEIDRLDAEAREHKRLAREHRRAAQAAAQQRDAIIAFCRANNIPLTIVTAQPGGTAHERKAQQPHHGS